MRPIVLIGGGGHCRSVIEAARSCGQRIAGVLDMPSKVGDKILDCEVIGTDNDISRLAGMYDFVVTVGFIDDSDVRAEIIKKVYDGRGRFGTIVASSAVVSPYARIEEGTVVLHNAVVNAGAYVGTNCIINTGAIIEHDTAIADRSHISTGAVVNGGCRIGQDVFIGSGTIVNQGLCVGSGIIVASASLVNRHLNEEGIYAGVPARKIERRWARH